MSSGIAYCFPPDWPLFHGSSRKRSASRPWRASSSGVSSSSSPAGAKDGSRVAWMTATSGGDPPTAASASFV